MRDGEVREKHQSPVDAPMQNIDYSDTFHRDQVDKRIMIETEYVLRKK